MEWMEHVFERVLYLLLGVGFEATPVLLLQIFFLIFFRMFNQTDSNSVWVHHKDLPSDSGGSDFS